MTGGSSDQEVIWTRCPQCQKTLKARRRMIGKTVRCPDCDKPFVVAEDVVVAETSEPSKSNGPDRVIANWQRRGFWYLGQIAGHRGSQTLVRYIDGDEEWCDPDQVQAPAIVPGLRVLARPADGNEWLPGVARSVEGDRVLVELCTGESVPLARQAVRFDDLAPGDAVLAHDTRGQTFRGVVAERRQDACLVNVQGDGTLAFPMTALRLVEKGGEQAPQPSLFGSQAQGYSFELTTAGWRRYPTEEEHKLDADLIVEHPDIGGIKCMVTEWKLDFEDLCDGLADAYRSEVHDFQMTGQGRTTVAGLPAAFVEYEGVPKEDQEKGMLKFLSHVFLRDGQVFQIIAIASPVLFGRMKKEAAEAIRTFSFDREVCREQPVLEETGQDALASASNLYCHSIYALIEVALATWLFGGPAMGLSEIGGRSFSMFGFFCFLLSLRMLWVVLPRIPAINWVPLYTKPMTLLFWIAWAMLGRFLLLGTLALLAWDFVRTTKLLDQQLGVKFDKRVLPRLLGGAGQITGLGCAYYLEIVAVYCLSAFVYMVFFS